MEHDHQASDTLHLVYRDKAFPKTGGILLMLGFLALSLIGIEFLWFLIYHEQPWYGEHLLIWLFIGFLTFFAGVAMLSSRELIFDKSRGKVVDSSCSLFGKRTETYEIPMFTTVRLQQVFEDSGGSIRYPVTLIGPQSKLQLDKTIELQSAQAIASEVGRFLDLHQERWDKKATTPGTADFNSYTNRMKWARTFSLIRPMGKLSSSDSRLVYSQAFRFFVKVIGVIIAIVGLAGLASFVTISNNNLAHGGVIVSSAFVLIGVVLILWRRNITFDKGKAEVCFWTSIVVPIWSRKQDISPFSSVRLQQELESESRVFLASVNRKEIDILKSFDVEELKSIANDVSVFLNYHTEESVD